MNKDLLRRVLVLMNSKHTFLALCEYGAAVISFFRAWCARCSSAPLSLEFVLMSVNGIGILRVWGVHLPLGNPRPFSSFHEP